MSRRALGAEAVGLVEPGAPVASAQTAPQRPIPDPQTGRHFATPEPLAVQDTDFQNLAMLWAGQSCASCHDDPAEAMRGEGARKAAYHLRLQRVVTLEQLTNICRTELLSQGMSNGFPTYRLRDSA